MRYINIEHAKPGMILAKPIYDENNITLLGTDTMLTQEYLDKIEYRGFCGVYIDDEFSEGIYIEESISTELRNRGVSALKSGNLDETLEVAKQIVDQLLSSRVIHLDMVDLRSYDEYTYRHSVNVCVLATVIGMSLNMTQRELVDLSAAAILHDLGKLLVDPDILNKPARLTESEYEVIKEHSLLSYEILKDKIEISSPTKVGVLFHHENENGTGYPQGLAGDDIHIFAKIIHVADVYDALTAKRVYKKPYAVSEAIEYLMGGCNILFDTNIVETFLKCIPVYPVGTTVQLSDGRDALIVENTDIPLRPVVRLENGPEINLNTDLQFQNITICPKTEVENDFTHDFIKDSKKKKKKKHFKILCVDDMATNLHALRHILQNEYEVSMVRSGINAIDYLKKGKRPDLILMDIDLPDMNGITTIEKIHKELGLDIPVIFVTVFSDRETVLKCKEVNAKDYIVKPYQPAYIKERIRLALEGLTHD